MSIEFSTGSHELDALLEELRAGDNVVLFTDTCDEYVPFVSALARRPDPAPRTVYARSAGLLDETVAPDDHTEILDLASFAGATDPVRSLQERMRQIGPHVHYVFEPLHTLSPLFVPAERLSRFFLSICPLLYQLRTVAYWNVTRGRHDAAALADIKDCTQVFIEVDRLDQHLVVTPIKVWGRYAEGMFRPHRLATHDGVLHLEALTVRGQAQATYAAALEDKNLELAHIRDALDRSNRETQARNRELAELNARLREQTERYEALHDNMNHLLEHFRAGQTIASSLVEEQVYDAIVSTTGRLFDTGACRLCITGNGTDEISHEWHSFGQHVGLFESEDASRLRERAVATSRAVTSSLPVAGSFGVVPLCPRGTCIGTLELHSDDTRLDTVESASLLDYLASAASIGIDNARLYRELEVQGDQLRTFVEDTISNQEQDSRRFAYDLHDGVVQLIVAAYQHLQSASAWRSRDPDQAEKEMARGTQLLRRAIYEARRLIAQLRPTGLDDFGLTHALRLHIAQLAQDGDWDVRLNIAPEWPALPATLEAALFRIVQEAARNAQKYAETPRLQIGLARTDADLIIEIQDWGVGFDPSQTFDEQERGRHVGIIGMRERARLWGGQVTIESGKGTGTTITVAVPIPPDTCGEDVTP